MRIQNKLFLTLSLTSLAVLVSLVVMMQWSVSRGMIDYINKRDMERLQPLISELANVYGQNESWQWLQNNPRVLKRIMIQNLLLHRRDVDCDDEDCHESEHRHRPFPRPDIAILDQTKNVVVSTRQLARERMQVPVVWNQHTVGWVSIPQHKAINEGFELVFIEQQQKAFWLLSLLVMVLAALIAFPLARHFVRPVERLTQAANQLTQGDYTVTLSANRNDELGQLARDFNELATTLEQNESSRKRWLADISHELRTPLAILAGEIEAMLDGVRPVSKTGIESMKEEVDHLNKLVNDLYELTKADIGGLSYRKSDVDLLELIKHKLNIYAPVFEANKLTVNLTAPASVPSLWADETRLNQLLDNLLTNCSRYTNAGGEVQIKLETSQDKLSLLIEDSAPGVADDALAKLFDHLYRTEQSRNRESGGSGLGLAICKRIVQGHDGVIQASHSRLGGVAIQVDFPL